MSIIEIDKEERIALPVKVIESLKLEKVLVVNAGDHVQFVPIPANLLQVLNGALSIVRPFKKLRQRPSYCLKKAHVEPVTMFKPKSSTVRVR